jgi:hypothetical protein
MLDTIISVHDLGQQRKEMVLLISRLCINVTNKRISRVDELSVYSSELVRVCLSCLNTEELPASTRTNFSLPKFVQADHTSLL